MAQNIAHFLGLKLNKNHVEVETIICQMYQDPKERLYQIILAFLRQAEPPPTWRAIVNALRSRLVNLTALAKRVETAHFPDPTASHKAELYNKSVSMKSIAWPLANYRIIPIQ